MFSVENADNFYMRNIHIIQYAQNKKCSTLGEINDRYKKILDPEEQFYH